MTTKNLFGKKEGRRNSEKFRVDTKLVRQELVKEVRDVVLPLIKALIYPRDVAFGIWR